MLFHCGNWAKSLVPEATMAYADILGSTLGNEKTYGFEHHGAMNVSHSAAIVVEAFETYFGWETYHPKG